VDTQGIFDNETTMAVTSCVFGLSTLISSYQIYNVQKQIQEDHLQQLALFTEYGRMALSGAGAAAAAAADDADGGQDEEERPFQRLEFLVRDWQNFDDDEASTDEKEASMDA